MTRETIHVLAVEDNADDVGLLQRLLANYGERRFKLVSVDSTHDCERRLHAEGADLILLDYHLPGEDGVAFLRRIAGLTDLPPVIIVTGQGDERVAVEAMQNGAFDYWRKDRLTPEVLSRTLDRALEASQLADERRQFDEQIMVALAAAAEAKDPTTGGHLQRLVWLTALLGAELGLTSPQLQALRCAALLHDIGKLAIPAAILCKRRLLTEDERDQVRQHPLVGERISSCLQHGRQVGSIIRHHHERWDGAGYPDGLAGPAIPRLARIVAVVDAFDAMSSDRPYRRALAPSDVLRRLWRGAGTQWDPDITEVFLDLIERESLDPHVATRRQMAYAA